MSTNDPNTIRSNIESTRDELDEDIDALADKVTPSKIVERQKSKVRSALHTAREHVMGAADDVSDTAHSAAENVGDTLSDTAHQAAAKAKGNPLAVGLIAFGAGWLAASLIPASDREKKMASQAKEAAQPLMHEATDAAKQVAENLKEPAKESVEAVKQDATEGAERVKKEATSAASNVKHEAQDAAQNVKQEGSHQ